MQNTHKTVHSVFSVNPSEVIPLIDEGWLIRGAGIQQLNGRVSYLIDMGRIIGTQGETYLKIITEGFTNEIVTACPVFP